MSQDTIPDPAAPSPSPDLGRRRLLALAGAAPLALTGAGARAQPAAAVRLTPQVTQGPYWFDPKLDRADVTEGKPGVPVRVAIAVLDADGRPLANARVDIWHCDASGTYSGYEGQGREGGGDDHVAGAKGQTFLRGAQVTGADGRVAFRSIWPGWYQGRAPHIHLKVHLDARTVLTCQLFMPDALSEWLYENVPAYRRTERRDTFNRQDGIARQGGEAMVAAVKEGADGYELALTVGVDPAADWKDEGFGPGGPMGGPSPGGPGRGPPPGGLNGRPPGPPLGGFPGGPPNGMGPPRREALTGSARVKAIVPGIQRLQVVIPEASWRLSGTQGTGRKRCG